MMQLSPTVRTRLTKTLLLATLPVLCFAWAYWITLNDTRNAWNSNPQYSHGYLVPIFAVVLLWLRRQQCDFDKLAPSWWGLPVLASGCLLRLAGAYFHFVWFDQLSLLPCIAGLALTLGGWGALRWSWQSILFLAFMIPLPYTLATAMSAPLQTIATICSTFIMQTLGLPAVSEGNIILVNDARIGVVEACSGLRMLVVFFALSTGMVMVIKRPIIDKLVLVVSAVPIALLTNVIRVTVTGLLYQSSYAEYADLFFHDVGGWLMPPLALGFLWLEMKALDNLFVEVDSRTETSTGGWLARLRPAAALVPATATPAVARTPVATVSKREPAPAAPRRTRYTRPGSQPTT